MVPLRKWLRHAFKRDFTYEGNTLPHGRQSDSHSCGIILANTFRHAVNGVPLWEQRWFILGRVEWFLRLSSRASLDTISGSFVESPTESLAPADDPGLTVASSIVVALGDHNFPDLREYALSASNNETDESHRTRQPLTRPTLLDILDTAQGPPVNVSSNPSVKDVLMKDGTDDHDVALPHDDEPAGETRTPPIGIDSSMIEDHTLSDNSSSSSSEYLTDTKDKIKGRAESQRMPSKRPWSSSTSDFSDDTDDESRAVKVARMPGQSRSGKAALKIREKLRKGEFIPDSKKLQDFKNEILTDDPYAEFYKDNIRLVRHSRGAKQFLMKDPYDVTRWRSNLKECPNVKKTKAAANTPSLFAMDWLKKTGVQTQVKPKPMKRPTETCACPGITAADDERVPHYLK
ncbi:hypothetical protein DXG01_002931 [Tephrocybe rancida]|nr:hypothetical protein DXG01_002931 [Tephrocybe rancida]